MTAIDVIGTGAGEPEVKTNYKQIMRDGLWDNNSVFCMILGMCPTMAMTLSLIHI